MAISVAIASLRREVVFGMARRHLVQRLLDQLVDQVVGLHAETLAAGDLDVRALRVFVR